MNLEIQANLIRQRRTKENLANVLGVSRTQLYARLRGDVDWSPDELWTTAELCGVALADLVAAAEQQAAPETVPA
jgi:hypothetical protein